ncbi:MAG TPA: CDP-alcohol phosphatidyltransferase family protein [Chitinophagaceae bacterium]|nr:CDP-alcohol phosphatidyltransferase family protein [Chitinophagaceae bacterium]
MKQIPNIFTLLNLVFGCLAIICILQNGLTIATDENGSSLVILPEKIFLASFFIGCAAVIDFLDGFVAKLLKASSGIGKQLDSLADVVSFGVAPGLIVYQFLRLSYAQQEDGLDISMLWLLPALLIPCAGAYRLARFNIDREESYGFKGVPIPAAGLLIASFPLIYWYSSSSLSLQILLNKWFWYAIIIIVCWLMVSTLPMMALKFKEPSLKKLKHFITLIIKLRFKESGLKELLPFIILVIVAIISAFILGWIAVPVSFIAYVILSLLYKQQTT